MLLLAEDAESNDDDVEAVDRWDMMALYSSLSALTMKLFSFSQTDPLSTNLQLKPRRRTRLFPQ